MNSTLEPLHFTVPLSFEAHAIAQQQSSSNQQTYLKALSVYAVEFYLRCLGIETDFDRSDWRDPWMAKFIDVADLSLQSNGKLECCYVPPDAEFLSVSPDAWGDRLAYIAVQINPSLKSATLIGFAPNPVENLPLSQLRSIEQFPDFLHQFQPIEMTQERTFVNLRDWLEGKVEAGWQSLESVLEISPLPAIAVRNEDRHAITVRQAKLIDVGMDLGEQSIVLSLAITVNSDASMNVLIQSYSAPGHSHLPPNLKLSMLSETGEMLQEVCSREQDNYIQLRHFRGEAGDSFDIQVSLDSVSITESFIL